MESIPVFWGMHLIWWFLWFVVLIWIFALPYDIPGSRKAKDTPLEILKRRLAAGEINDEEYQQKRKLLKEH
jgi:putative membrane protein